MNKPANQQIPYKLGQLLVKLSKRGFKSAYYNIYQWKGEYFESIPHRSERDAIWSADQKFYKPYGREKVANMERNNVEWMGVLNNQTGEIAASDKFITRAYQGR